jgi:ribosomal protein S18 acetylase RimI-like enzyme
VNADDRFARTRAFERDVLRRTSTSVERFAYGFAYLNLDLPHRFSSNLLWVEPDAGVPGAGALVDEADRVLGSAGLAHRKVVVDGEPGRALAGAFLDLGWVVEHLVGMTHERAPDRPPALDVERVGFGVVRSFAETVIRSTEPAEDDAVVRELVGHKGVLERRAGASFFIVRIGTEVAGACELYVGDGVAQIEDVNTLEEYRGRGVARAVVLRAAEAARASGADLVFLDADADDWPRLLYGRLGFDPVGESWEFFHRPNT